MKHVGVNMAADPLFSLAYTGVNGGFILVSANAPLVEKGQADIIIASEKLVLISMSGKWQSKFKVTPVNGFSF